MRGAGLRLAKIDNVDVSSIRGRPVSICYIDIYIYQGEDDSNSYNDSNSYKEY